MGLVHPEKKLCDGRFSRARRSDDECGFVGWEVEGDVRQDGDGGPGGVGKGDVVEREFTVASCWGDFPEAAWGLARRNGVRGEKCGGGCDGDRRDWWCWDIIIRGDERQKGDHGEFSFREGDELRNAHLQVARGDKARPKDGHDISSRYLAISDQFRAEPEALDEHPHHNELRESRGHPPDCVEALRRGLEAHKGGGGAFMFVRGSVESFDGGYGSDGAVDDGCCDRGMLALRGKER